MCRMMINEFGIEFEQQMVAEINAQRNGLDECFIKENLQRLQSNEKARMKPLMVKK